MSALTAKASAQKSAQPASLQLGRLLQRKCACGGSAGISCACTDDKRLQRELSVGASHDPLELEADRVADQVMRSAGPTPIGSSAPSIQPFRGVATAIEHEAPASVDHVLASGGRPLEASLRTDMEQRFGHDFASVRVHAGAAAEQSARDVNANAYTVGRDIVFGAGRFAPGTHEGRRLLAHELTHVVQQQGGTPDRTESTEKVGASNAGHSSSRLRLQRSGCDTFLIERDTASQVGLRGTPAHWQIKNEFVIQVGTKARAYTIPGLSNAPRRTEAPAGRSTKSIAPQKIGGRAGVGTPDLQYRESGSPILEVAEIKPAIREELQAGEEQLQNYVAKGMSPENADWRQKMGIEKIKAMEPHRFNPLPTEVMGNVVVQEWCAPGLLVYKPMSDPEQPRGNGPPNPRAPASARAARYFVTGFLVGARRAIPGAIWAQAFDTLSKPANAAQFLVALRVGQSVGMAHSLADLLGGLKDLAALALRTSPVAIGLSEIAAVVKREESPLLHRARLASTLAEGLTQFVAELGANPDFLSEVSAQLGEAVGAELGRRLKQFSPTDPVAMGMLAGEVEGYVLLEIAMLLVGAEELGIAAKTVSLAARNAKLGRIGAKVLEILSKFPALRRLLNARALETVREFTQADKALEAESLRKKVRIANVESELEEMRVAEDAAEFALETEERANKMRR